MGHPPPAASVVSPLPISLTWHQRAANACQWKKMGGESSLLLPEKAAWDRPRKAEKRLPLLSFSVVKGVIKRPLCFASLKLVVPCRPGLMDPACATA